MANTCIFKKLVIRSAVLVTVVFFSVVGASQARAGTAGNDNMPTSSQNKVADSKQSSGWGDTAAHPGNSQSQRESPASGKIASGENPSAGWQPAGQGSGSCRHSHPDQEEFLCKLIRIFYGPDSAGPNRDMDNNISAGGAGG